MTIQSKKDCVLPNQFSWHVLVFLLGLIFCSANGQSGAPRNWVDGEARYVVAPDVSVVVQNSLPKGGGRYSDSSGKLYSYVVFWTRVTNRSNRIVELHMQYPREPFYMNQEPDSFIRIFLPPDRMTTEKIQMMDYGLSGWRDYLDHSFDKPSTLRKVIDPGQEVYFYTQVLFSNASGATRAALVLEGKYLRFKIKIAPAVDPIVIPCGKLVLGD